ncbi:hypothetical protein JHK82_044227 [Glycine max]|uniref:Uncharacterized protein n=2 Tax=Glycine subgen. Soja TaxID=1462606 RepID=A0A0R0FM95_SOYBN|nr:hypothetical protein JHK86_044577 [Glycine max]RZB59902.1 hypothetical protein D0Y65_042908 [Glycine soja]KAG4951315.1 hypothetical protein JHK85_045182 [Glycine max]KAG5099175.1 hypothetical protein JHK82_044227 [Glycine max]KAG5107780.1 hypothetical protein JHK84_044687 [Glycine max]
MLFDFFCSLWFFGWFSVYTQFFSFSTPAHHYPSPFSTLLQQKIWHSPHRLRFLLQTLRYAHLNSSSSLEEIAMLGGE